MKKYSFALVGGLLLFAACSSNNSPNNQAAIDSMANAKANAMQNTMAASNDSMINAVAKQKADSIEMAKHMEAMSEKKEGHGRREEHRDAQQAAPQIKAGSTSDRPGASNSSNNATSTNGTGRTGSTSDRPGASSSSR